LKKKYDYWWKKKGLEKTDRTETLLFDRNWTTEIETMAKKSPTSPGLVSPGYTGFSGSSFSFFIENDFSRLTTISHFPLLFLRKSAIFQVEEKCTSLVGSRNKLDHSEKKYELTLWL
jgi:hypothetical protein